MCDGQTYRAVVLSLCPPLLCLDGAVVTDKDILPAHHELLENLSLFNDMHHKMLPPVLQVCCGGVGFTVAVCCSVLQCVAVCCSVLQVCCG